MKLRNLFYLLLLLPLTLAACTEKEGDPTPEVNAPVLTLTSNATMQFAAEGGMGEISYTLENAVQETELTATCSASWITDIVAGQKVRFTVTANEGEAREAKITVAYGEQEFEVVVKQVAGEPDEPEVKEPVLTLTSDTTMEFAAEGGLGEIAYTLENPAEGVELTATTEADWITGIATSISTKVLFTVEANKGEARETKITVAYGEQSFEVVIKQAENPVKEPVLTLTSAATMEFTAEGGAGEITYTLENAREGVELTAACEAAWITDVATGEKVTFAVEANKGEARETKITVTYGAMSFEVDVKQAKGEPEDDNYDPNNVTLTTMGEITYGTWVTEIPLSDSRGKNSVTLVLYPDAVVDGYPVAGEYPTWQSDPSYVMKATHFSFKKNSLMVDGTKYSNNDIAYTPKPACTVTEDGTITLTFTVGDDARTFTYYRE